MPSINELSYMGFRRTKGDDSENSGGYPGVPALLVPSGKRHLHFAAAADEGTDWAISNPTNPTFYIHSETTPATDYLSIAHDGTDIIFTVGGGNFLFSGGDLALADGQLLRVSGFIVGGTTQVTISDGDGATDLIPNLQALGTGVADGSILAATFNTTNTRAVSPHIALVKGAAATQVATTAVADNEVIGSIIAYGSDGTDFETPVAAIEFVVDDVGGPGT